MFSKKALTLAEWIAVAVVSLLGFAFFAYLMLSGWLPKAFGLSLGQLKAPSISSISNIFIYAINQIILR